MASLNKSHIHDTTEDLEKILNTVIHALNWLIIIHTNRTTYRNSKLLSETLPWRINATWRNHLHLNQNIIHIDFFQPELRRIFVSHNGETELLIESLHFLRILILVHNGNGLLSLKVIKRIHHSCIVIWCRIHWLRTTLLFPVEGSQLCIKHLNGVCADVSAISTASNLSVGAKLRIQNTRVIEFVWCAIVLNRCHVFGLIWIQVRQMKLVEVFINLHQFVCVIFLFPLFSLLLKDIELLGFGQDFLMLFLNLF